ncbi:hypothetical protein [Chryseobacterium sp.]|uniref:hypothetical protein n=1 Tax=Chryseobacterium sp. TaxID=1871047 RepID=UPI0025BC0A1C|nr:hypothetical protein [Chryseobacterium sp.]
MNPKELRIGNYIQINEKVANVNFELFRSLHEKEKAISNKNLYTLKVSPIELTDEWFNTFGFEIRAKGYTDSKLSAITTAEIIKEDGEFRFYPGYTHAYISIKYVHQLQNLYFSLTHQEIQ